MDANHAHLAKRMDRLEQWHNGLQGQVDSLRVAQHAGQAQQGQERIVRPRLQEAAAATAPSPMAAQPGPALASSQVGLAEPQQAHQVQQAAALPSKQAAMDAILEHSLLHDTVGQAAVQVANRLRNVLGVPRDSRGLMPARFKGLVSRAGPTAARGRACKLA